VSDTHLFALVDEGRDTLRIEYSICSKGAHSSFSGGIEPTPCDGVHGIESSPQLRELTNRNLLDKYVSKYQNTLDTR
jgi:hypothetical protein